MDNPPKKIPKNFTQLCDALINRNVTGDRDDILQYVTHLNYYIIGMYSYKLQKKHHGFAENGSHFIDGTTLQDIKKYYLFDRKLAQLILEYLTIIEESFKSLCANILMSTNETYWPHLSEEIINSENSRGFYKQLIFSYTSIFKDEKANRIYAKHLVKEMRRRTRSRYGICDIPRESFPNKIKDFLEDNPELEEYVLYMPLNLCIIYIDFQKTLFLYKGIKSTLCKQNIANIYGLDINTLDKLIQQLVHLRNRCAHPTQNYISEDFESIENIKGLPKLLKNDGRLEHNKLLRQLEILQYFLKQIDPEENSFAEELKALVDKQENPKILQDMGCKNLEEPIWDHPLWKAE
ncbi:MAG: Abi family protein [Brevinema sp.]